LSWTFLIDDRRSVPLSLITTLLLDCDMFLNFNLTTCFKCSVFVNCVCSFFLHFLPWFCCFRFLLMAFDHVLLSSNSIYSKEK
jgi:hypothetical protein